MKPKKKLSSRNMKSGATLVPVPKSQDFNPLNVYLKEVEKIPLLSPEEEHALALRVYEKKDTEALKKLVAANLRFVLKLAFEFSRYGARVLDLVQEGNMGLLRAVREFNPYKGTRLTSYAVYWIRSYIQDYLMRNWSLVRVGTTAAQKKLFYNLKKEVQKWEQQGLPAEPKAIAMDLGLDEDDVKMMQERLSGGDVSLSTPLGGLKDGDATATLGHNIVDAQPLASSTLEENQQAILFKKALKEFRQKLDPRELKIFEERLVSETPKTLIEIGESFNITKERARQLEERIKQKLKDFLSTHYPDISID